MKENKGEGRGKRLKERGRGGKAGAEGQRGQGKTDIFGKVLHRCSETDFPWYALFFLLKI